MRVITMSPNVITRTLTLAKRLLEDSKGRGRKGSKTRLKLKKSPYIYNILKNAKPDLGMICRKCDKFIVPKEKCYSKQGNDDLTTRLYYHLDCLYQE